MRAGATSVTRALIAVFVLAGLTTAAIPAGPAAAAVRRSSGAARPAIDAGANHSCVLAADGTVKCWGDNFYGQLGNGTTTASSTPTAVPGLSNVTAITTGALFTCALITDGTVKCWGYNELGAVGNGVSTATGPCFSSTACSKTPVNVPGLTNITAIAAGARGVCALVADGTVKCWGWNADGELGNGTKNTNANPVPVTVSGLTGVRAVTHGFSHACALLASGLVYCWGYNGYGQLGIGSSTGLSDDRMSPLKVHVVTGARAITANWNYTCALLAGGTVDCWGTNSYGLLGRGTFGPSDDAFPTPAPVHNLANVTAIDGGIDTICALLVGSMKCWGYNYRGAVGDGTVNERSLPTAVSGITAAAAIAVGSDWTCALSHAGTAKCWGKNQEGELGIGSTDSSPHSLPAGVHSLAGSTRATVLAAGGSHTCALQATGALKCWGRNAEGEVGDNTITERHLPTPVTGITDATTVAAGGMHSCARRVGGTVKCWGLNSSGQLGDNTTLNRRTPTAVTGLTNVAAVATGSRHTCALLSNGTVKCWGLNSSGQLGDGTTTARHLPTTVSGLAGVIAISAGGSHTCAVLATGGVKCWGLNTSGQLGDGTTTARHLPTPVSGTIFAVAIAAGGSHTCALTGGGMPKCWGSNSSGQIGDNTTTPRHVPTIALAINITTITAGGQHTCGIRADGLALCWGENGGGQLGDNTNSDNHSPDFVVGPVGVTAINAGGQHTCRLEKDGTVRCWGHNHNGQVGNNSITDSYIPLTITGF